MKIIIFQGGLGNQLFENAFYNFQSKLNQGKTYFIFRGKSHNGFELSRYFKTNLQELPYLYSLLFKSIDYIAKKLKLNLFTLENDFYENGRGVVFDGYWQNKEFLPHSDISFKELPLSQKNLELRSQMESTFSVSIHVRRGDYLLPQFRDIYGNVCTAAYYQKAIELCKQKNTKCNFFIFSDDIKWCKENLQVDNATFIDWNTGDDSIYDMYLMSFAKINIIANSTFSFWGASLNKNNILTIYPKKWFNSKYQAPNIFPEEWVGL